MELLLCRHGRTEHNDDGIVQGHLNIDLNEMGIRQSRKLAERLEDLEPVKIYSSPLKRALHTSEIISDQLDAEVHRKKLLEEVDQGVYEGKTSRKMKNDMEKAESEDYRWAPEGGESMEECQQRAEKFLNSVRNRHHGEIIVAVAHGGFNKTLILEALGRSAKNFNRIKQANCCLNRISSSSDFKWRVEQVNDTSHLS